MRLAYKTYGTLNAGKDNVIVYPTSFSAQHSDTEWLIRPGGVLDPDRYFIVIPNLFGNGLSSSPSNSGVTPFPDISYHDAVAVQRRLLVEQFGISKIALVYGWSMGGMQAYHWAACHPDMVERAAVVCGSAQMLALQSRVPRRREGGADRGSRLPGRPFRRQARRRPARHGARLCRLGDVARLLSRRDVARGRLRLAGRLSRPRLGCGFRTARRQRSAGADRHLAARRHQPCAAFGGDIDRALAAIKAQMLLMPGQTDRYFDFRDNEDEIGRLVNAKSAELHPIPSIHGHRAGNPVNNPRDRAFINAEISALLQQVEHHPERLRP